MIIFQNFDGKEFKNKLIEDYLKGRNINFMYGLPYNPHSQSLVERFHKTIKEVLYFLYFYNNESFDI